MKLKEVGFKYKAFEEKPDQPIPSFRIIIKYFQNFDIQMNRADLDKILGPTSGFKIYHLFSSFVSSARTQAMTQSEF